MLPLRHNNAKVADLLTDCSKDNIDFANNFNGIFREFLAIYLRDTGKSSASVVSDTDPLFVNAFLALEKSLKLKYVSEVKADSKCDSLAQAFKKERKLPNIISFFEKNDAEISAWALNNVFDSSAPHLSSQTDAGVAVTLFQEYLLMHDTLIPNQKLPKKDKLEIMKRSIRISQLLQDHAISKFDIKNADEGSRFVAMQDPKVLQYFRNLVTFPIFRQSQINEVPKAMIIQHEIIESFKDDLKPELKRTKTLLIASSAAAGVLLLSTVYLLTRKKREPMRAASVGRRVDMEDSVRDFNQLPDTVPNIPVLEDSRQYARTDLKPIY
jgi:hypothetical protein